MRVARDRHDATRLRLLPSGRSRPPNQHVAVARDHRVDDQQRRRQRVEDEGGGQQQPGQRQPWRSPRLMEMVLAEDRAKQHGRAVDLVRERVQVARCAEAIGGDVCRVLQGRTPRWRVAERSGEVGRIVVPALRRRRRHADSQGGVAIGVLLQRSRDHAAVARYAAVQPDLARRGQTPAAIEPRDHHSPFERH